MMNLVRSTAVIRLAIGLVQGLFLYLLYHAADAHVWPSTQPYLFVPLGLIGFFVPLIIAQGLTIMRLGTLLLWSGVAAALLAVLGVYDRYRLIPPAVIDENTDPTFTVLMLFSAAALFIAHALVAGGDLERRWLAPYRRYFAIAWTQGLQLALSLAFTGAFWLVLLLGAQLFKLIGLDFFQRLIEHAWFAIPATALALSLAVHVTDIKSQLVEGLRVIALALLSWLLPLMAALAAAFLVALLFTGLAPLWATRNAASILLIATAALVILLNAAFQDGDETRAVPKAMKLAAYVAGLVLLPFVLIAAYAIYLRVAQYGWTAERISAVAVTVVAVSLAGGYFAADILALTKKDWRLVVERTNIGSALLSVIVIVAIFSPVADPLRVAVNSQVARLESGIASPAEFDFVWLRFDGQRFGQEALQRLKESDNAQIATKANEALKFENRYAASMPNLQEAAGNIKVYPQGRSLPESLLAQRWPPDSAPRAYGSVPATPPCFVNRYIACEAFFVEMTGDTRDDLIFTWGPENSWLGVLVSSTPDGHWQAVATLEGAHCKAALEALRAGLYHPVAPLPSPFMSLDAGETRLDALPIPTTANCPAN